VDIEIESFQKIIKPNISIKFGFTKLFEHFIKVFFWNSDANIELKIEQFSTCNVATDVFVHDAEQGAQLVRNFGQLETLKYEEETGQFVLTHAPTAVVVDHPLDQLRVLQVDFNVHVTQNLFECKRVDVVLLQTIYFVRQSAKNVFNVLLGFGSALIQTLIFGFMNIR